MFFVVFPANRCPWKFPIRSFPTASCLCSLNRKSPRNFRLRACAVAEHPPPPSGPWWRTRNTLNLPARTRRDPIWAAGGSNLQQLGVFITAGVSYLDFLNNRYKLSFFFLICKCSLRRITNTRFTPGGNHPITACHPSVHTWPQDYLILGTAGALTGAFEVGVAQRKEKFRTDVLFFWSSHILDT